MEFKGVNNVLLVQGRSACTCTSPVVCYILQEIQWCTWSFVPAGLFLPQGFFQWILLPAPPPYSFSTDIFTVTGAFCFSLWVGESWLGCSIVPAIKAFFNLGTGCQKWKLLDTPGTQTPLNNAVIHVKCKQCTSGRKDTKCQFQHLTLFKIANKRAEYIK